MTTFWSEIGSVVGHSGEEVERLIKNLSSEYQKVRSCILIIELKLFTPEQVLSLFGRAQS